MKHVYKTALLFISAIILCNACKKGSNPAPKSVVKPVDSSSMSFSYNGTKLSFNHCEEVYVIAGSKQITITGVNLTGTTISDNSFEVDILQDPTTLKTGQAFHAITSFQQESDGVTLFFSPNAADTFTTQPANPVATVTLTEVTSTYIKGTFSGSLYDSSDFDAVTLAYNITTGTFTALRQN